MRRVLDVSRSAIPFLDDVPIGSSSPEEHLEDLVDTLDRLTDSCLRINLKKSHFFRKTLLLLGQTFSADGISIDKRKLVDVENWPRPISGKDIERYLGLVNYFRDYIPCYSTLAAPLESMRKMKEITEQDWIGDRVHAFEGLKSVLREGLFLHFPNFEEPFFVATDASDVGVGAVLYQLRDGAKEDVSANRLYNLFAARALHSSERNYSATKKELLGIVIALKRFHYFLWGRHFILYTDHRALTFLFTQKDPSPFMSNWIDVLLSYDFSIVHRPGILNFLPDALSRLCPAADDLSDQERHKVERL